MKTFITNAEFNQVLELLGLPGETLSIEIRGREAWPDDRSRLRLGDEGGDRRTK